MIENKIILKKCPIRNAVNSGIKNVEKKNLVDPKKIFLPSLHIKLSLIMQLVKALRKRVLWTGL